MTYKNRLCLIVCENLAREAMAALFAEKLADVALATFPAQCDQPNVGWDILAPIPRGDQSFQRLYVMGRCREAGLGDPPPHLSRAHIFPVDSCLHLFVTPGLAASYASRGSVLLLPWELDRWRREGISPAGAQDASRLVLVDSGVHGEHAGTLAALAGTLGCAWEVLPVGLDLFRLQLVRAMLERQLAEEQSRSTLALSEAIRRSSDHAMALDLIGGLTRAVTESETIDNILDLFTLLFAPGSLVYLPWVDGRPGTAQVRPPGQAEPEELYERLAGLQNDCSWSSSGSGFHLRIAHQEETLGLLAIEELAFPEHIEHYLNLALILGRVCGLTIANARSYEKGRQAEEIIRHQAYHDTLTGLPNRRLFNEHLNQALNRARRDASILAVLFIDLDHFKQVNDTLGHETGDVLIKQVASRLQKAVRTGDLVARMGGDEFLLLLSEVSQTEDALRVAQRIRAGLAAPFHLAGHELHVTASIGLALYPSDGADAETLMKNADVAMYRVKESGRDGCRVYGETETPLHGAASPPPPR